MGWFEVTHGENSYATEMGKLYKSGLDLWCESYPWEADCYTLPRPPGKVSPWTALLGSQSGDHCCRKEHG